MLEICAIKALMLMLFFVGIHLVLFVLMFFVVFCIAKGRTIIREKQ